MNMKSKAWLVGGGIGSLAAAAFMTRDGGMPRANISILQAAPVMGGSLDGAGYPAAGYSMRGGRRLTTDNYECIGMHASFDHMFNRFALFCRDWPRLGVGCALCRTWAFSRTSAAVPGGAGQNPNPR